jgi:hypothetical protein
MLGRQLHHKVSYTGEHFPNAEAIGRHAWSLMPCFSARSVAAGRYSLWPAKIREDESLTATADGGESLATTSFCVMAVTMDDLFADASDSLASGVANGGYEVAIFSFSRYHPHITMHPGGWYDY